MVYMTTTDVRLITPNWRVPEQVVAYSTVREGGVSCGSYSSLNVGDHVGDEARRVIENRKRLPYSKHLNWMKQVHGSNVARVSSTAANPLVCDGLYSEYANCFCAVMTADCIPILLTNKAGEQVAAVHAGWKGLKLEVIKNTLAQFDDAMCNIVAWIGPCISAPFYEVDNAILEQFSDYEDAFSVKPNTKYAFDLALVAERQLRSLGVEQITKADLCTYSNEHLFFSHRRSTHQGEKQCGRQVSVIGFRGS